MAALAPPPYRPSPAPHSSPAPSSASSTNSATPSKKQQQLDAGRRRLEEFKRKKAAEKGKKISAASSAAAAAAVSDQLVQSVADREQLSVLPAVADSSVPTSKEIDSNGHASEDSLNNDNSVVSAKSSLPSELAAPSVVQKEHTGAIPSVSDTHLSTGESFRKDPQLTAVPSGGSNDGIPIRGSHSNVWEQASIKSSATTVGKLDGESGSLSDHDAKYSNKTGTSTAPLGVASPIFVPASPPARKEIFGSVTSTSGHAKPEITKNPVAVHPSPFNKLPSSSQGFEGSFNPSSQKPNGAGLVMLDSKLVPKANAREGPFHRHVSEPEQELTSAKSRSSAWMSPSEGVRTDNHNDGTISTSTLGPFSHINVSTSLNLKSENEKGSDYPPVNSSLMSTLPPSSLGTKTSLKVSESIPSFLHPPPVSEATAPKHLPLPPPLFRPPISTSTFKPEQPPLFRPPVSTSTFKPEQPPLFRPSISTSTFIPEPFVTPVFKNDFDSGSSSSSFSTAAPSTSSFLDNALPRSGAPTFQFPGSLLAINAIHENGKPNNFVNPVTAVPKPSSSVGEIRTHPIKAAESVDQPRPLWPPPSGGDDFLEQHIEDLTQEKFSLQRGLDAARALAETLAQENSALTEDFNNQGALVNELKAEAERLQGEIRAQAVVVKNMKGERDKAVHDCKAAVERSQALAAEVIELEEKVLRARSQELKLQRETESLSAETESQRRQIVSMDKDRSNLKTLMEALQEEKGLLQTQIRKATSGGNAGDSSYPKSGSVVRAKADAGTSTDDLELETFLTLGQGSAAGPVAAPHNAFAQQAQLTRFEPLEQQRRVPLIIPSLPSRPLPSPSYAGQTSGSFLLANEFGSTSQSLARSTSGRGLKLGPMSSVIPPDQAATIGNINNLVTELAEEKEALVKALRAESVGAAELRSLNAELSHKLEVQTQRLELAVAQSMANDGTPRAGSTYTVSRLAPEYVDEGDEVVDRVLGWIMQLFPSGSSRRKRL